MQHVDPGLRELLEKRGLYESFERYFQGLCASSFGRRIALEKAMEKFRKVLRDQRKDKLTNEKALEQNDLLKYSKANLPLLPTVVRVSATPREAKPDDDGDDASDEWRGFDLSSVRERESTLAEDCRWIYNNCLFDYADIDPSTVPSVGALGWLMRVKVSDEARDKFYKETLHRYLGKQTGVEEEDNQQDRKLLRLLGKVKQASLKAQGLSEAEDGEQDAALPPGPEGDSGEHGISRGHVGVGG